MKKQEQVKHQEKMIRLVRQWETSGEIKSVFCETHNIRKWQFYYWCSKYEKQKASQTGFSPLEIQTESKSKNVDGRIEIRYLNGTSIHLPIETSVSLLRNLVAI